MNFGVLKFEATLLAFFKYGNHLFNVNKNNIVAITFQSSKVPKNNHSHRHTRYRADMYAFKSTHLFNWGPGDCAIQKPSTINSSELSQRIIGIWRKAIFPPKFAFYFLHPFIFLLLLKVSIFWEQYIFKETSSIFFLILP